MKLRLLTTLLAAAALSGCATYDTAGGSGPGGYYHGRPSVDYYGPYGNAYGYPSYGYPGYGSYSRYGYGPRYYGAYGGYYGGYGGYYNHPHRYYRPHYPRPPRADHDDDHGDRGDRPAPWRRPDGRYQDTGQVMVPPHARGQVLQAPSQQIQARPARPIAAPSPRTSSVPTAPRVEQSRPVQQVQRAPAARERSSNRSGVRTSEE